MYVCIINAQRRSTFKLNNESVYNITCSEIWTILLRRDDSNNVSRLYFYGRGAVAYRRRKGVQPSERGRLTVPTLFLLLEKFLS
jgi:hypothetical protein